MWRQWLAKTGTDEATHRPFYGRRMPIRRNENALFLASGQG